MADEVYFVIYVGMFRHLFMLGLGVHALYYASVYKKTRKEEKNYKKWVIFFRVVGVVLIVVSASLIVDNSGLYRLVLGLFR